MLRRVGGLAVALTGWEVSRRFYVRHRRRELALMPWGSTGSGFVSAMRKSMREADPRFVDHSHPAQSRHFR